MRREGNAITFTPEEAATVSGMLADGMCFLAGWECAKGELPAELVSLRNACREINISLKGMEWPGSKDGVL